MSNTRLPAKVQRFVAQSPEKQKEQFLAWVAAQPADKAFNYMDNNNCAKSQFGKTLLGKSKSYSVTSGTDLKFRDKNNDVIARGLSFSPKDEGALCWCRTFGEVYRQLR